MSTSFNRQRFIDAQSYDYKRQEIRNGSLLLEGKRCSKYICYISVVEDADFRRAFHIDFDGMDDQDCDPDELGWYYFIG